MKTVLAPGAPWPVWNEEEVPKPKPKPKPKKKKIVLTPKAAKRKATNDNFERWLKENL